MPSIGAVGVFWDAMNRADVFCANCEELFNYNGEAWVLRHCNRPGESFLLNEALNKAQPAYKGEQNVKVLLRVEFRIFQVLHGALDQRQI